MVFYVPSSKILSSREVTIICNDTSYDKRNDVNVDKLALRRPLPHPLAFQVNSLADTPI